MARLRKRLPRDFEQIVASGDLEEMQAVFSVCDINARSAGKAPGLSTYGIPEALIRWMVASGADIEAPDDDGETPLHHHAGAWNGHPAVLIELGANIEARDRRGQTPLFGASIDVDNTRILLAAGADVHATNLEGHTALEDRMLDADTGDLDRIAATSRLLVDAGATVTDAGRAAVVRLGEKFEAIREVYNPDSVERAAQDMAALYELFDAEPAPAVQRHDGVSPIELHSTDWRDQYDELWASLVPAMGPAPTVQGETVRIATRVLNEIEDNGSVNWDDDFRAMLDSLPAHLSSGTTLTPDRLAELDQLVRTLRRGRSSGTETLELVRLVVVWVSHNLEPMPLVEPPYRR
ncbi:ankyrin repeat domain-containing protein [Microbacterium sp. A588]